MGKSKLHKSASGCSFRNSGYFSNLGVQTPPPVLVIGFPITNVSLLTPPPDGNSKVASCIGGLARAMHASKGDTLARSAQKDSADPSDTKGELCFPQGNTTRTHFAAFPHVLPRPAQQERITPKRKFPEWPFPLLLLLFLAFSPTWPNKKELPQKERSAALPLPRPLGPPPQLVIGFPITNLDLLIPPL